MFMDLTGLWLTPLVLLPGVALLILSTSVRLNRLHDEVHELADHPGAVSPVEVERLMRRARLYRDALVALYVCVGLFALASLLGIAGAAWSAASRWIVLGLLALGIASLLYAAAGLIRESVLSLTIITAHAEHLRRDGA
ncbi:MAG: DUF2721 domain-containing protein [Bacteroidetes bacterium]|nr:MAG: DUF2721 domain-containing protein [Bacteroidota bacterium]